MKNLICLFFIIFLFGICVNTSNGQQSYNLNITDSYRAEWAEIVLYENTYEATIMLGEIQIHPNVHSVWFVNKQSNNIQPIEFEASFQNNIGFIRMDFTQSIYEQIFIDWEPPINIVINGAHVFTLLTNQ